MSDETNCIYTKEDVEAAVKAEREACAQVAERTVAPNPSAQAALTAKRIRAGSQP